FPSPRWRQCALRSQQTEIQRIRKSSFIPAHSTASMPITVRPTMLKQRATAGRARSPGFARTAPVEDCCMKMKKLGRTGLLVSEICLGTMTFGGSGFWRVIGALDQEQCEALVKASFDAGVNFFDTADVYSNGESERALGAAIGALGLPRDEIVVATKAFGRL